MKIRGAKKEDTKEIAKLMYQYDVYENNLDKRIEISSIKSYEKEISEFSKNKSTIFLVGEENGEIVGFINFVIDKRGKIKIGVLQDIFVKEKFRGKKIGEKLVNYVLTKMEKERCQFVKSAVRVKNKKAQKFWERQGFKISYKQTEFGMRKNLN